MSWWFKIFCAVGTLCIFSYFPIGKIAAHSACGVFSWYKCLIANLVFSHLGFWSGNLFLIAPFHDLCLPVTFSWNLLTMTIKLMLHVSRLLIRLIGTSMTF